MGNRPFILPAQIKKEIHDLSEWGNLKNKFSGKTLFRSILYDLETGDLSALDVIENKWFYEELFSYVRATNDVNLKPVFKKIAGSLKFPESIRQHASEIEEIIDEQERKAGDPKIKPEGDESEKAINALRMLAENRYPHTTEILRLLRDMSPGLKRLSLFLIGKFKMTDMIQDVCGCLNIPDIQEDAESVLMSFGDVAAAELERCYLTTSGNVIINKAVLRVLAKARPTGFFADRLWSSSRQTKEFVLSTLLVQKYNINQSEKEALRKEIVETFGILAWLISAQICLTENGNNNLITEIQKEYKRWKNFLLGLLILTYDKSVSHDRNKDANAKDDPGAYIPKLSEIIFGSGPEANEIHDQGSCRKTFKKLQQYISCEIPLYKSLLEYIINCDYNLLSIWTKACALRSISEIDDENLSQSAVALLFSPEPLLREEAARLISRADKELFSVAYERIPDVTRTHLDKIVREMITGKELIYEKVFFLSTCFKGINEDELIFLAQNIMFISRETAGIPPQAGEALIWLFKNEESAPEVIINQMESRNFGEIIQEKGASGSFCYVLPLKHVKEFRFQYPESSFEVFRYIDSMEK